MFHCKNNYNFVFDENICEEAQKLIKNSILKLNFKREKREKGNKLKI